MLDREEIKEEGRWMSNAIVLVFPLLFRLLETYLTLEITHNIQKTVNDVTL